MEKNSMTITKLRLKGLLSEIRMRRLARLTESSEEEVKALKWGDIDFDIKVITIPLIFNK